MWWSPDFVYMLVVTYWWFWIQPRAYLWCKDTLTSPLKCEASVPFRPRKLASHSFSRAQSYGHSGLTFYQKFPLSGAPHRNTVGYQGFQWDPLLWLPTWRHIITAQMAKKSLLKIKFSVWYKMCNTKCSWQTLHISSPKLSHAAFIICTFKTWAKMWP